MITSIPTPWVHIWLRVYTPRGVNLIYSLWPIVNHGEPEGHEETSSAYVLQRSLTSKVRKTKENYFLFLQETTRETQDEKNRGKRPRNTQEIGERRCIFWQKLKELRKFFWQKKSKGSCENLSRSLTSCEKFWRKEIKKEVAKILAEI